MPAPKEGRTFSEHDVHLMLRQVYHGTHEPTDQCVIWRSSHGPSSIPIVSSYAEGRRAVIAVRRALVAGNYCNDGHVIASCWTDGCVNPRHLTRVLNARPNEIGQSHHTVPMRGNAYLPKVSAEVAAEIRSLLASGLSQGDIAAKYDVSQSTISRINRSKQSAKKQRNDSIARDLRALGETMSMSMAAQKLGVSRSSAAQLARLRSITFKDQVED